MVLLTILVIALVGAGSTQVGADEGKNENNNYHFGIAYQQYLLGTKSNEIVKDTEDQKVGMGLGSLGSGGVSGKFSYDDMMNKAQGVQNEENRERAENGVRRFASTMSTYATFNYFSNRPQSFSAIFSMGGRWIAFVILLLPAFILDVLNLVIPTLIGLIAKLNVISLLADILVDGINPDTPSGALISNLEELGITRDGLKNMVQLLFGVLMISILLNIIWILRKPGTVDRGQTSKLKGRLISLLVMPIILGLSAELIGNVMDVTAGSTDASGGFSRYLVDVRSWAYNYNFAPDGGAGDDADIHKKKGSSSYVDLSYNPYTGGGKSRISDINADSSLVGKTKDENGEETEKAFPNSSLLLTYGSGQTFSAVDYINYKGTANSATLYGSSDGDGAAYGSYYQHAKDMGNDLVNVEKSFRGSGKENKQEGANENAQDGGYAEAIDDYGVDGEDGKKLKVSPQIAWRDRYIYGAKTDGAKLDEYYGEAPSYEQMNNKVGMSNRDTFSDQSMFLILSTAFDETGGRYTIDAPSRGIKQKLAQFDSDRSDYYAVSMTGNYLLTLFGLFGRPLMQIVILCAVFTAVMSMGLLEMNLRPLAAWFKGSTLGDLEYVAALAIYAVGIFGTVLFLSVMPSIVSGTLGIIPGMIAKTITWIGDLEINTPQSAMVIEGSGELLNLAVSFGFGWLFIKSVTFRKSLIHLMTMPWAWADENGRRLERQASGGGQGTMIKQNQAKRDQHSRFNRAMDERTERSARYRGDRFNARQATNNPNNSRVGRMKNRLGAMGDDIMHDLKQDRLSDNSVGGKENISYDEGNGNVPSTVGHDESADLASTSRSGSSDDQQSWEEEAHTVPEIKRRGIYERSVNSLDAVGKEEEFPAEVQEQAEKTSQAVTRFYNKPTDENYEAAKEQMDTLNDTGQSKELTSEQKEEINKATEEFYNLSREYDVDEKVDFKRKEVPQSSNEASFHVPHDEDSSKGANEQRDSSRSEKNVNRPAENTQLAGSNEPRTERTQVSGVGNEPRTERTQTSGGGTVINNDNRQVHQTDNRQDHRQNTKNLDQRSQQKNYEHTTHEGGVNNSVSNHTVQGDHHTTQSTYHTDQQTHNMYHKTYQNANVQEVAKSLGNVSNNDKIASALDRLNKGGDSKEKQQGMTEFRQAMNGLKDKDKKEIDSKRLDEALHRLKDNK